MSIGLGTTQHFEPCEHNCLSCVDLTSHSLTLTSVIGSSSADSDASFFLTTLKAGSCPIPLMPSPYISGLHCMKNTKRWSDLKRVIEQSRKSTLMGRLAHSGEIYWWIYDIFIQRPKSSLILKTKTKKTPIKVQDWHFNLNKWGNRFQLPIVKEACCAQAGLLFLQKRHWQPVRLVLTAIWGQCNKLKTKIFTENCKF